VRLMALGMRPMIYVVDDDEGARASLGLLLECEGLEVREFTSCREFLDITRADAGDCLILDVHMRGINGLELLETIWRCRERLQLIIVSGRLDDATRARAEAAGVLAVVDQALSGGRYPQPRTSRARSVVTALVMPVPATTTRQRRSKVRSVRRRPARDSSIEGLDFNDAGADLAVIDAVALGEACSGDFDGAVGGGRRAHDK